jgi:Tol biopolymer transport system component/DNA-binding winged helix-turn-helix (wHTH) protein
MYNIAMNENDSLINDKTYNFGDWHFNPADGQLISKQNSVRLQPRLARLLCLFVMNEGALLARNQLIDVVWKDKSVNEDALSRCVAELRAALGDSSAAPLYIETVPKKGYRFIQSVNISSDKTEIQNARSTIIKVSLLGSLTLILIATFVFYQKSATLEQPLALKSALLSAERLTTDNALEYQPELSSLGELLAFSVRKEGFLIIKILNSGGELIYKIAEPERHLISATFSPDDSQLLVASVKNQSCQLYIYQLPTLKREKLAECTAPNASGIFDWSVNTNKIAYVHQSTDKKEESALINTSIWLFDLKTRQHQQITQPTSQHVFDTRPQFSPDGKFIAFTRGTSSIRNIFIRSLANNSNVNTAVELTNEQAYITSFSWLNNSSQLVYDSNVLGDRNLWLIDIDTHQKHLLGARDAKYPSLNHNNTRLAFQEVRYNANIWQLDITGNNQEPEQIIESIKYNNFPSYSPDGKRIAFVSNRKGKAAIWLYSLESKKQIQLLAIKNVELIIPNWSHDGKNILVSSRGPEGYRCYQIDVETKVYQPLYSVTQQHHKCQYSNGGDIFMIMKEPSEKSKLVKLTKEGEHKELTNFSVDRIQTTRFNNLVYSQPNKLGLYSIDFDGNNNKVVLADFDPTLNSHWSIQGNYLYYPKTAQDKGIWRYHLLTGEETKVANVLPTAIGYTLSVSPDHSKIIYSQTDSRKADIYFGKLER